MKKNILKIQSNKNKNFMWEVEELLNYVIAVLFYSLREYALIINYALTLYIFYYINYIILDFINYQAYVLKYI